MRGTEERFRSIPGRLREELEDLPITHPEVIKYIGDSIRESLEEIKMA